MDEFITVMEWIGTIAFAVSGAVVAIEKGLDYYGIGFLAIITAIGGGLIRDTMIGTFPNGLANPWYAVVSIITAAIVIMFYKKIDRISHLVSIADGIGLAAFTAIGSRVAVITGHASVYIIVTMAVLTGTFGGVLRDVLAQELPRCFHREVYAVASIMGAISFAITYNYIGMTMALYVCFGVTLVIRLFAIFKKLDLGKVKLEGNDKTEE